MSKKNNSKDNQSNLKKQRKMDYKKTLRIFVITIMMTLMVFHTHAQNYLIRTLKGHSNNVNSVAFSPDGRMIASGSRDKLSNFGMPKLEASFVL